MAKDKVLATPHRISEKGRQEIAEALNPLVADAFALYIKTKAFHWHVYGSHFRDYHLLFDEQAEQIFNMTDILAERVRKLGGTTIRSINHISKLTKVKDEEHFLDPVAMLTSLMNENKALTIRFEAAHEVCEKYKDVATTSIIEIFLDETERRVWFLFEAQATK
jgi:starvation-inducible DNA-binding protein